MPSRSKWRFWHEDPNGGWINDGELPAPIQEQEISDGRTSTTQFLEAVDGSEIVLRSPQRSKRTSTRLLWHHEMTGGGAAPRVFAQLNSYIKSGVGVKMETHVNIDLMGYFQSVNRKWEKFGYANDPTRQQFVVEADFKFFAVDGTGSGF